MSALAVLCLAASVDGAAAQRHASQLTALGPHPFGSPRAAAAAQYVAAQLRSAGLADVKTDVFSAEATIGHNVTGVLRGREGAFLLLAAHHDTAPDSSGGFDAGGAGVLIEVARVMAGERKDRRHTLVFASFDGSAGLAGNAPAAGARAYVESLGARQRELVAALIVETAGAPAALVLHTPSYTNPLDPGRPIVAPGWLLSAERPGSRFVMGGNGLGLLYQAASRALRPARRGDDAAFLASGNAALRVSDTAFGSASPNRPSAGQAPDVRALAAMGDAVIGSLARLDRVERGRADETTWLAAGGFVLTRWPLFVLGCVSLVPMMVRAMRLRGPSLALVRLQAVLSLVACWREPVVALWLLFLLNLAGTARPRALFVVSLLPALALLGSAGLAWQRGWVSGLWTPALDAGVVLSVLAVVLLRRRLGEADRVVKAGAKKRRRR